jgi:hypothetical protein
MSFNLKKFAQQMPLLQSKPAEPAGPPAAPEPAGPPKTQSGPHGGSGPGGSVFGKKRIRDRGIKWEERYGEKSDDLKRRFDKMIGVGAYMRFEGHDYTSDGDYFIVVGPAITEDNKKKFFAGIKRLPDDPNKLVYSPSGEYFSTSNAAYSYANEKWGLPYPKGLPNYTEGQLQPLDIPRHVKG